MQPSSVPIARCILNPYNTQQCPCLFRKTESLYIWKMLQLEKADIVASNYMILIQKYYSIILLKIFFFPTKNVIYRQSSLNNHSKLHWHWMNGSYNQSSKLQLMKYLWPHVIKIWGFVSLLTFMTTACTLSPALTYVLCLFRNFALCHHILDLLLSQPTCHRKASTTPCNASIMPLCLQNCHKDIAKVSQKHCKGPTALSAGSTL